MRWFLVLIASSALAQNSRDALQAAMEKQRAAAAIQRESVRKQQELMALPPLLEKAEPECEAMADSAVNPIIEGAAKTQELQAKLVRAVIQQESAFRPCAVSARGAKGLMQLMPEIIEQFEVSDPFDPKESIEAGARYLKQLMDRYKGDLALTLGAYNAGPATVDEAKGVPNIPETRSYVEAILQALGKAAPDTAAPTQIDPPRIPTPKPIGN
jgi:soluble lytic murein transglycosylase-like protein